jgi:hypothetical protein
MISPRQEWIDKQSLRGIRLDGTVGVRIYLDKDLSSVGESYSGTGRTFRGLRWIIYRRALVA